MPGVTEQWTFLTNHAHVLVLLDRDPDMRMRDLAREVGITERATQRIISELVESGYLTRRRQGRRNTYTLHGDLTIKDVTRNVAFDLEFDGANQDPWGGTRASFTAAAEINRKDWGLEWNVALESGGVLVSEKVKITLDIQLVKA